MQKEIERAWFTSDFHHQHKKIVEYTNRDVETTQEDHDEYFRDVWNALIRPTDTVFHLGDFSFSTKPERLIPYVQSLNGRKIFIKGNHDTKANIKHYTSAGVECHDYLEVKIKGQSICMFHFPMVTWHRKQYGAWHLFGHVHGNMDPSLEQGKMLDVGLDSAYNILGEHRPFRFEEIAAIMQTKQDKQVGHHTQRQGEL